MALYRYVPGKAQLEALMLDTALGAAPDPAAAAPGGQELWRARLRAWAMTMFERMLAHPWAHELAQGIRPVGPNEVGWMESALTALAGSGLTGAESLDTIALLAGHVRGLALQAAASGGDNMEAALGRQVSQALAVQAGRYPARPPPSPNPARPATATTPSTSASAASWTAWACRTVFSVALVIFRRMHGRDSSGWPPPQPVLEPWVIPWVSRMVNGPFPALRCR